MSFTQLDMGTQLSRESPGTGLSLVTRVILESWHELCYANPRGTPVPLHPGTGHLTETQRLPGRSLRANEKKLTHDRGGNGTRKLYFSFRRSAEVQPEVS